MGIHIPVESVYSTGQKERRIIETLEPAMSNHRVVIDTKVARNSVLMEQVTRLTYDRGCLRHDDQLEALAGVVYDLSHNLSVDPDKLIEEHKRREMIEELARFGPPQFKKPKASTWLGGRRNRHRPRR